MMVHIYGVHRPVDRLSVLLSMGLVLVLVAWLGHDLLGGGGEAAATLLGSGLLVSGHWQHWRGYAHNTPEPVDK